MTRKEELIERAKKRIDSIYGSRAEHCMGESYDEYVQEVMGDYLQVEREVWALAESKALSMVDYADDDYKLKVYADWCKAQQQERT